ncbi:hypothetical protein HispidOSU_008054 [Sigmodon hispidus]
MVNGSEAAPAAQPFHLLGLPKGSLALELWPGKYLPSKLTVSIQMPSSVHVETILTAGILGCSPLSALKDRADGGKRKEKRKDPKSPSTLVV